ncbi:MAG: hypothetical protein WA952_01240 [Lewinella sp.]
MKNLNNSEYQTLFGGSCPYCDGRDAGEAVRSWFGWLFSSMHEGMMMTNEALSHGK